MVLQQNNTRVSRRLHTNQCNRDGCVTGIVLLTVDQITGHKSEPFC